MNKKKNIFVCLLLILLCIIYTVLVKVVDARAIGPKGSSVGFATINKTFSDFIGVHMAIYKITEILGYLALLVVAGYGLYGLIMLIKRKSLFKVDKEILLLGGLYVIVFLVYVFFEKIIINYRPILIDGVLEVSYPSSHTVLAICVCYSAIMVNKKLFKNKNNLNYFNMFLVILMFLILLGRVISGVHWFTDIIGGIMISIALLKCFKTALDINS